ncbi:MAG: methyltransferase domain-containing protein, partial [Anaerolineales bacterium]|nr:methyltransferase domain-containing protein [Anaerolineales bacterium]
MPDNDQPRPLSTVRAYWDHQAATFDNEPDHGLRDPEVREAWTQLLRTWLPEAQASVLDIGCGTGSLSLVLAELGHRVTGIDLSPAMIAQAARKAARAGLEITFQVMDAAHPQFAAQRFEAIVCRHLLWALPDPAAALRRWTALLEPGGRLLLIEGYWHTGGGLHAEEVTAVLPSTLTDIAIHNLS